MGTAQGVGTEGSADEREDRQRDTGGQPPGQPDQPSTEPRPKRAKVSACLIGMLTGILDGSTWDEQAIVSCALGKAYLEDPTAVPIEVIALEQGDLVHALVPLVRKAVLKTEVDWWAKVIPRVTVEVRAKRQRHEAEQASAARKRQRAHEEAQ